MEPIVTPLAAEHALKRIEDAGEPDALGLRVGVRGGGCSGYYYVYDIATSVGPRDQVFEKHGLQLVVDTRSLKFLDGATLDWETRLMGHGFTWKNPHAVGDCGCGSSFHVSESFFEPADGAASPAPS